MGGQNSIDSKHARVRLELKKSVFVPGETISGKVHLQVLIPFEPKTLFVQLKGKENTFWHEMYFEDKTAIKSEFMPRMSSIRHRGEKNTIVKKQFPVCEWDSELAIGGHSIPFKLTIPEGLPGSIQYHKHPIKAEINYELSTFIKVPFKISNSSLITIRQPPFSQSAHKLDRPVTQIRSLCQKTENVIKLSIQQQPEPYNPLEDINFSVEVNNSLSKIGLKGLTWKVYYMVILSEENTENKDNKFFSCKPILDGKVVRKVGAGQVAEGGNAVGVKISGFKQYIEENPIIKSGLVEAVMYLTVVGIVDTMFGCFGQGPEVMGYLRIGPTFESNPIIPDKPENWSAVKYHTVHLDDKADTEG